MKLIPFSSLTPAKWKLFQQERDSIWSRMNSIQNENKILREKLRGEQEMRDVLEQRVQHFMKVLQEYEASDLLNELISPLDTEH